MQPTLLRGSCLGVGVPALVGLPGAVLVAAAPVATSAVAVGPVAAGRGDDGAAELSQQLRDGDGDQPDVQAGLRRGRAGGRRPRRGRCRRAG